MLFCKRWCFTFGKNAFDVVEKQSNCTKIEALMVNANGFLLRGIVLIVAMCIRLLKTRLCILLGEIHIKMPIKKNVQNAICILPDYIAIKILFMVNKNGYRWDGIAGDANLCGWMRARRERLLRNF